ncbi:MAG: hypothetical protein QM500_08320 [Methylococcales bacterium]
MSGINIRKNRGAALLMFVMISIIVASALLLKALNIANISGLSSERQVLNQAKQALLGYAISYGDKNLNRLPGYLPCPDRTGDGLADSPCGGVNSSVMGRLPWKTLGLPALRDGAGECLWYAVSGAYKESPQGALSTDADGQFLLFDAKLNSLNGLNNKDAAIAIIFSAGKAVANQNRSVTAGNTTECGSTRAVDGVNLTRNYFEQLSNINNANGSYGSATLLGLPISPVPSVNFSVFIDSGPVPAEAPRSFNDTLMKLSARDMQKNYTYMQKWVGKRVRQCLARYAANNAGKLPWPAVLIPPGNPSYNDNATQQRFGRIASNLSNSQANGLNPIWPMDPLQAGTRCFNWNWWPTFRETVFYAIDNTVTAIGIPAALSLTVDTVATTAVILVAGRKVDTQQRITGTNKATLSNYLESGNVIDLSTGSIPPGDENFISSDTAAAFFNDYVCTLSSCP